ncbi:DNA-binding protein [Amycolatopsis sp.]|uniref:DNA-binding protein n=1 Tax=Amycolatopsis sp. TaxID=37632 RepID=UPI002B6C400E|nr:DNA-binding protein [Amycolatopsis sp.]HVV11797.1 DNA-binding protein [Amycolatopsis sp.]
MSEEFPKGVGAPAVRALHAAGYTELADLNGVSALEVKKLHGMGPKALARLQEALVKAGYSFG